MNDKVHIHAVGDGVPKRIREISLKIQAARYTSSFYDTFAEHRFSEVHSIPPTEGSSQEHQYENTTNISVTHIKPPVVIKVARAIPGN
jgi:hypothetical protein